MLISFVALTFRIKSLDYQLFCYIIVPNVFVLPLQFDMVQSAAGVAVSDSSDKSKEKSSDQKVVPLVVFRVLVFLKIIRYNVILYNMQTLRRLAQNREAARKSRLRKKVGLVKQLRFSFRELRLMKIVTTLFIYRPMYSNSRIAG